MSLLKEHSKKIYIICITAIITLLLFAIIVLIIRRSRKRHFKANNL